MTLNEIRALFEHWHEFPPIYDLVRWFVGYQSHNAKRPRKVAQKEMESAIAAFGTNVRTFDQLPDYVQQMLWQEREKAN